MKDLVGKKAYIKDKDSIFCGEWGRIIAQDENGYYIAIADGRDSVPVFDRNQFTVRREKHASSDN